MKKIFISTTTFAQFSLAPLKFFQDKQYDLVLNDKGRKLREDEITNLVSEYHGILAGTEIYSKKVFDKAAKLKVISRLGVGLDNVDLDYSKIKGVKVFKTQTTPAPAVAELSLGLILDLLRNISLQSSKLKSGTWNKKMGSLMAGKTLGIIGLGTIGKTLVKISQGFGLKYLAYDLLEDKTFSNKYNLKFCNLEKLLSLSDIISIHLNLSKETNNLINYNALKKMKREAILINTSRGEIINENALYKALKSNRIAGAALDVFEQEPYVGPLTELDNIVLTPHIGAYAREIRVQMEIEAAKNLIRGLDEK